MNKCLLHQKQLSLSKLWWFSWMLLNWCVEIWIVQIGCCMFEKFLDNSACFYGSNLDSSLRELRICYAWLIKIFVAFTWKFSLMQWVDSTINWRILNFEASDSQQNKGVSCRAWASSTASLETHFIRHAVELEQSFNGRFLQPCLDCQAHNSWKILCLFHEFSCKNC